MGDARDRRETPREFWGAVDFLNEAREQRLVSRPLDGVPDVVPTHLPVSFNLFDKSEQRARQRRCDVNAALAKHGLGPLRW